MKYIVLILISFIIGCSGGSGGDSPPPPVTTKDPFIFGDGIIDYYKININGTIEESPSPLEFYIGHLSLGNYIIQIQAIDDIPVNFRLFISEYPSYVLYEIVPDEGYEVCFKLDQLIAEVPKESS